MYRARALAELATAAGQVGDTDRVARLATGAEDLARAITDPDVPAQMLAKLASACAKVGDPDRAEALARTITDPDAPWRGHLLTWPSATAKAGRPGPRRGPRPHHHRPLRADGASC